MQRWHLLISGKVQGVFYRKSTAQQAQTLGLTGYVRNLEDGQVEVIAEGSETTLEALYNWCWQGPEKAKVEDISRSSEDASGTFSGFVVKHSA